MDNRVSPLSVTHRVGVVAHPILVFAEYTLVGIIPTSRACWDCPSLSGQRVEEAWRCVILTSW